MCQNAQGAVAQFSAGIAGSCPAGSSANPAAGCPDGYKSLTAGQGVWQNAITVWRNNNYVPNFDNGYIYRIAPLPANGAVSLDVVGLIDGGRHHRAAVHELGRAAAEVHAGSGRNAPGASR